MKQRYESITETSRLFRKKIMLLTIFNVNVNEIKKEKLRFVKETGFLSVSYQSSAKAQSTKLETFTLNSVAWNK